MFSSHTFIENKEIDNHFFHKCAIFSNNKIYLCPHIKGFKPQLLLLIHKQIR